MYFFVKPKIETIHLNYIVVVTMICEKVTSSGNPCPYYAKRLYQGKRYCGAHFKRLSKGSKPRHADNVDSDGYDGNFPKQRHSATNPPKPFKPFKSTKQTDYYDSDEYDEYDESKYPAEWSRPTKKHSSAQECKELMDLVNTFLRSKLKPDELKKQGRAILRKIHPDKCRVVGIDSHTLTQKVLKRMQRS